MPSRVQQLTEDEKRVQLCTSICRIFEQAGNSAASHKKNCVALLKVHQELALYTESFKKGKRELLKLTGEKRFQDTFKLMLTKIILLKKGDSTGDRIVKFVGGYIRYINEKALEDAEQEESIEDEDSTTASRFTAHLLHWLFEGFLARDKNVRFRVLQMVAEMIAHLGAIDEDDYKSLRAALIDRLNDKESIVRYQAVISLSKLCGTEDPSEMIEGEQSILSILLDTMGRDSSADVRRAALVNIPITDKTLPAILERTKDTDINMRKAVYDSILGKNVLQGDGNVVGPTHPRVFTIQQRETIVKHGLGDREPAVRAVAANLLANWVDVVETDPDRTKTREEMKGESGVLAFLAMFDLNEGDVAANSLSRIFHARADIFDNIEFNDEYWTTLNPEKAYLARVFVDHCRETKDNPRLETALPVVTAIAFRVQQWYNSLQDEEPLLQGIDDNERQRKEDEIVSKEIILSELLKLAVNLDYADEIGRRKMFDLVREMLRQENLPLKLVAPCLDVMSVLSAERDLIRLVVETIQELRDFDDGDDATTNALREEDTGLEQTPRPQQVRKSLDNMAEDQRKRLDQVDLRCLSLCHLMLERVNSTFEENIMLDGILQELIIPSVQRKDEIFRILGVKCLALCCLIARRLAERTIPLFMSMITSAPQSIKTILIQALFDMFMVHEGTLFKHQDQQNNTNFLTSFVLDHIEQEQDPTIQAIFCRGTAKLVLSGMIADVKVVKNLIKVYISPATVDNQELRQCLAFFLPTYSHSSPTYQRQMQEIFVHVFLDICQDRKEADEDDEIIGSLQVSEMFLHWTDPVLLSQALKRSLSSIEEAIQLDLAADVLKLLFERDLKVTIEKEDKKVLCQCLNKLHIPGTVDDYKIRSLKLLIDHLRSRRPLRDSACVTALTKFESTISKKFEKQLEQFSEEEFRKLEELNELFEFLDSIIPLDDEDLPDPEHTKRGRKRRSESAMTTSTTEDGYRGSPIEKSKGKRGSKRARLSSECDDDDQSIRRGSIPPTAPTRTLPRRAAAARKPIQPIVISDDEAEVPEQKPKRPLVKDEESQLDRDISALLGNNSAASTSGRSEVPYDSIMDPDSEDEEEEVNDLLADD